MNDILFELLQVAIGNRRELTRPLSADEWASLRLEFKKQGMLGIGYVGITRLPQEQCPPIQILAQWVHNAEKIRKKNERLSAECASICETLEHDGIRCCVIKGQSNLVNYVSSGWDPYHNQDKNPSKNEEGDSLGGRRLVAPQNPSENLTKNPEQNLALYRTPGDIDLWCKTRPEGIQIAVGNDQRAEYETYKGIAGIVEYAQQWRRLHDEKPIPWHRVLYYHVEINMPPTVADKEGTEVELHYRPSFLCNPVLNRRLQRWFQEVSVVSSSFGFNIPTNSFNAVYQLVHIFRHLFEEGIGLRQLLDYYFVLRFLHIEQGEHSDRTQSMAMWEEGLGRSVMSNVQIMHQLKRFGLDKFASAVMYVLKEAFNMPDVYLICKPNEKEGRWLLTEIMQSGNFGRYDERNEGKGHINTKLSRTLKLIRYYPHEALWQPYFMTYHWLWRRFEWWKTL